MAKTMENFSSNIIYRSVVLLTSADIVQHSFIIQKSISPLNLELSQSCILQADIYHRNYPTYSYSGNFISTEEKCRKVHTKRRNILYTLHLDLPCGREWSLRSDEIPDEMIFTLKNTECLNLSRIFISAHFYFDMLQSLINYACKYKNLKYKVLKWFLNLNLKKHMFRQLSHQIMNHIMDCMTPSLEDSEFAQECFRKLDLINWLTSKNSSKSERVSNLLYHFHRIDRNGVQIRTENGWNPPLNWTEELIDMLLTFSTFGHIGDVLKLKNSPSLGDKSYCFLREEIVSLRSSLILKIKPAVVSRQRYVLLLQVYWVYLYKEDNPTAALEYLSLVWRSVSDSFIISTEFKETFASGVSSEEIAKLCDFYSEAVGKLPVYIEPRPLQHYARTVVRRILYQRKHWLPEGIEKSPLPPSLQSYCNLEN